MNLLYVLLYFATYVQNEQNFEFCTDSKKTQQIKPTNNDIKYSHHAGYIFSPNYPLNYTKNNECFILIKAPRNYLIRLSFDNFYLEPSVDCIYDFLEIRDGPYGYSPLLGKYCGKTNAHDLLSSGNELWIKFSSDDFIEQTGFKLHYEFKKILSSMHLNNGTTVRYQMKPLECDMYRSVEDYTRSNQGDSILTQEDIEKSFEQKLNDFRQQFDDDQVDVINSNQIDCTLFIEVDKSDRIFLNFELVNISSLDASSVSQNCTQNFIQVYDGSTSTSDKKFQFCTSASNKIYKSKTNRVFVRNGPCDVALFDCLDNTCINRTLACNGRKNCNHSVDEIGCLDELKTKTGWTSEKRLAMVHTIIISVVGLILLIAITTSLVISCRRSLKANRLKREEYESVKLMKNMSILSNIQEKDDSINNSKLFVINSNDNPTHPIVISSSVSRDNSSLNLSDAEITMNSNKKTTFTI